MSLFRRRSAQPLNTRANSDTTLHTVSEHGYLDVRAAEPPRPHSSSGPTLLHRVSTLFSTNTSPTKKGRGRGLSLGLSNKTYKAKRYQPESRSPSPPSPDIRLPDGLGPRADDIRKEDEGKDAGSTPSSLVSSLLPPSPVTPGFATLDRGHNSRGFWAVRDIPPSPAGTDTGVGFPQYASQQYLDSPGLLSSFPVPPNKLEFDTPPHLHKPYTNELHFDIPSFGPSFGADCDSSSRGHLMVHEVAEYEVPQAPPPPLPLSPALLPLLAPYIPLTVLALVNKSLCLPLARAGLYRVLHFGSLSSDASEALVTVLADRRELAELVEELHCENWPTWFLPSSLWSSCFSIAFSNMKDLKRLTLPRFYPTVLDVGQTSFRLTELTLLNTLVPEDGGMDELWEWLSGQVDLAKLAFPKLLDAPTDAFPGAPQPPTLPTYFLPSLTTLHAPPSLVHLLMTPSASPATSPRRSSRQRPATAPVTSPTSQTSHMSITRVPLTGVTLPISTTLYTPAPHTLRPNALMRALRGVMELRLEFKEEVDVRSVVRSIGSVGEVLGDRRSPGAEAGGESTWDAEGDAPRDTADDAVVEDGALESLDIEVGWERGDADEALHRAISTILPRFRALRTLRLTSSRAGPSHRPKGPAPPSPLCVLPPTPRRHSVLPSPLPTPTAAEKYFRTAIAEKRFPPSPSPLSQVAIRPTTADSGVKPKKKKIRNIPPPILTQRGIPSVLIHRPTTPSPPAAADASSYVTAAAPAIGSGSGGGGGSGESPEFDPAHGPDTTYGSNA
ncbi:hypothetical protein FIBSPDRAFT_876523, partial [Athelia psychrophila]